MRISRPLIVLVLLTSLIVGCSYHAIFVLFNKNGQATRVYNGQAWLDMPTNSTLRFSISMTNGPAFLVAAGETTYAYLWPNNPIPPQFVQMKNGRSSLYLELRSNLTVSLIEPATNFSARAPGDGLHIDLIKTTPPIPSQQEIAQIANQEARRLGYDVRHMTISIDEQNSQWNHYLAAFNILNVDTDLAKSLNNKQYWAVYYAPRTKPGFVVVGGDLFMFVEKATGRVLTYRQGQ